MFQQSVFEGPGTAAFSSHMWEVLLMLTGAFILGYLLRYFLGAKWRNRVAELESENTQLKAKIQSLSNDLDDCSNTRLKYKGEIAALKTNVARLEREALEAPVPVPPEMPEPSIEPVAIAAVPITEEPSSTEHADERINFGAAFNEDNLQIVEGIGPKIEQLLKNAGIASWKTLSNTESARLREVLDEAGPRYKIHNPKTWPKQAGMANTSDWEKLVEYQRFLGGGKETGKGTGSGISKVEKLAVKKLGITLYKPDDLKAVEGIGPKTEALLKANGIGNWQDLANTSVNRLQDILTAAGDRFRLVEPGTWPEQANLAAAGEWKRLEALQDMLDGGKKPTK